MNIGKKLSSLRQSNNFSQDQLAEKLLVSRQTVSNWETEKTYPDINSLVMISDIFDLSLDQLIKEDLPLMKNKIKQTQIRWLGIGVVLIIALTYLSLIVLKWSVSLGSLLVGATTVVGLILIYYFWKAMNSANLKSFKQVIDYANDQQVDTKKRSKSATVVQSVVALIAGIAIGLFIVWLIFHFALGIV
jgi:transcriptional regulator with XRE-family HTH domain